MKKIIFFLLGVLLLSPLLVNAVEPAKATLFNVYTGERKVVIVGQQGVWGDGWELQTPDNNYNIYPQIYRVIDPDTNEYVDEVCYGYECNKYKGLDAPLGANPITRYKTTLSSSMTSSQATVPASRMTTFDGTTITMGLLGGEVFLTIEPGANKEEIVRCTGISGTTFTTCTRGLAFSGDSTSAVAANKKTHNAGSVLIMSNVHYVYNTVTKDNTWSVIQTYSVYPESSVGADATTTSQLITFGQASALANQGAATSTETISGISELATRIENASSTVFGVNDPHVQQSQHSTSTPSANIATGGLWDVWTENDGKLNQAFLDLVEAWTLTGLLTLDGGYISNASSTQIGNFRIDGNATTTGSMDVVELCIAGVNCRSDFYRIIASSTDDIVAGASSGVDYAILPTTTIAANLLGTDKILKARINLSDYDLGNGVNHVFILKFGGNDLVTLNPSNATGSNLDNGAGFIDAYIYAKGTAVQEATLSLTLGQASPSANGLTVNAVGSGAGSVDTTSNQDFSVTLRTNSGGSGGTMTNYIVELLN